MTIDPKEAKRLITETLFSEARMQKQDSISAGDPKSSADFPENRVAKALVDGEIELIRNPDAGRNYHTEFGVSLICPSCESQMEALPRLRGVEAEEAIGRCFAQKWHEREYQTPRLEYEAPDRDADEIGTLILMGTECTDCQNDGGWE